MSLAQILGNAVIAIVMASALIGAIASLWKPESELGKEFLEGLFSIGPIFVPVAGIMALIPLLSKAVSAIFGPALALLGADPAMAATSLIAVDMGGYSAAKAIALSNEGWILAMINGYLCGATIVFSIPVGLAMLPKKERPLFALGILSGILSVPFALLISGLLVTLLHPLVRPEIATTGAATIALNFTLPFLFSNLLFLLLFVALIAVGLRFFTSATIKAFLLFGRGVEIVVRLALVFAIIEYFTGVFSTVFGFWPLDPIIADSKETVRALEVAGYIGIMLCGAFPMVVLIKRALKGPIDRFGKKLGLSADGAAGLLASSANILAMYRILPKMTPREKVINVSFAVCGAFLFGDHLAFTANFQPALIAPVLLGKLGGALVGLFFAFRLTVPLISRLK